MEKSRRISTLVMGLFLFILVTSNLVWCGTTQQHEESSSSEENIESLPCIHQLAIAPVAGTVDSIVKSLGNGPDNYVSLVRFNIKFDTTGEIQHNQTLWNWGLGRRGRFMLSLPDDYYSLSSDTLQFGIHSVSIALNSSFSDNGPFSDICLVKTLFNISRQVRLRVQTPYSNDNNHDVMCRKINESHPFNIKLIPGYSLFQWHCTNYKCWNSRADSETEIHCITGKLAFCVTYPCIFLAVAYKLWCIYAGAFNHKKDEEESVNILQINLIPTLFGPYSPLVYAILFFIPYLVKFLWHVIISEEYENICNRLRKDVWMYTWGLDFILANILYILGLLVLYMYMSRSNNDGHVLEKPYNLATKKTRIVCYAVVFILCFFRLSATIILFVEIVLSTAIGIIININYVDPIWINVIIAVLLLIAIVRQFFDKYQALYNNIYSIGRKVDEENTFPNKIFELFRNHENGASQRQFKIKSSLLKDIVKRRLPLSGHLFNSFKYILIGYMFIGSVALIHAYAHFINQHVKYVLTVVSLLFGASSILRGNPLAAGEKKKNRAQDEFIQLEADLIQYAETGEIPRPEASHWRSFFRRVSSRFSNAPQRYQDDEYEILEGSTDSHSHHSV